MKLEDKIYASIGLTVFLTIVYYYVYSFVDLYVSKLCDKYVCFEFPPYADVLALWVAIIGLYFVVTSLDAWKHQDKYQTAKINLIKLHEISSILLRFKNNLSNFDEVDVKYFLNSISDNEITETNSFKKYEELKSILTIKDKIEECDLDINTKSINLFQSDFEYCISLAKKYLQEIDKEVIKLNDEKIVNINKRITKEEEDKKAKKEKINNMPDGIFKTLAEVELGASNYSLTKDITLNSDLINLDINTKELKNVLESKNNYYIKFISKLESIQDKINNYLG
ncbi:hypothetical protein VXO74_15180 [Acinetobacter junii]|uniref:hypothetical protein n=1 Tax=Acinetobacter junii TaxID=40215 RepID=UPI003A8C80FC